MSRSGLETRTEISHSVQFYPATRLINCIDSSRKLKVTSLILGRSTHTLVSTTATDFGAESHLREGRSGSNQTLDRPCVQDRMTPTFCSRSVTESSQEVSALVRLFVCLQAGLYKNYFTDFHKIHWKGSTWTNEETIRFFW